MVSFCNVICKFNTVGSFNIYWIVCIVGLHALRNITFWKFNTLWVVLHLFRRLFCWVRAERSTFIGTYVYTAYKRCTFKCQIRYIKLVILFDFSDWWGLWLHGMEQHTLLPK